MTIRRISLCLLSLVLCSCSRQAGEKKTAGQQALQAEQAKKMGVPVEKTLAKSGIVLRFIPSGTFLMGSPENENKRDVSEAPHTVTLATPFFMGKYEVTQGQWKKIMGSNPSRFKNAGDDAPVEMVRWDECEKFMRALEQLEGMPTNTFRLPTEAEWEYACRAGTITAYHTGGDEEALGRAGWFIGNSGGTTHPVGGKQANDWGLHDMHGNVWEWCGDWYGAYAGNVTNPAGAGAGTRRVFRGGSRGSIASGCRAANRGGGKPDDRSDQFGLRICMTGN